MCENKSPGRGNEAAAGENKQMTHQVIKTQNGYGIQSLATGSVFGSFDTFGEAMEALAQSALADQMSRVGQ